MDRALYLVHGAELGGESLKPVLYQKNETQFRNFGLGEIADAYLVEITRERNGNYTLYMQYPLDGAYSALFENGMKIKADAGVRTKWQTFEINRVKRNSKDHIEVFAKHISHQTEYLQLNPKVKAGQQTAGMALGLWRSNLVGGAVFDVWSDIEAVADINWEIGSVNNAREALGGVAGSILDRFGGEYEFDNTLIRLHRSLGRQAPIVLEYGRNVISIEQDDSLEEVYTSIYPYSRYTKQTEGETQAEEVLVTLPELVVDGPYLANFDKRRIKLVDFSGQFQDQEVPTVAKLRTLAQSYVISNRIGLAKAAIEVDYVDLAKTLDYKDFAVMEEVELCDVIPLYYPKFGITSSEEKVIEVVYDVLNDENKTIKLGTIGQSLSQQLTSSVVERVEHLEKKQASQDQVLSSYLVDGKGNRVWRERPGTNLEHKVGDVWFEKNGLYERMYVWDGNQWEKILDTEDVENVSKKVAQVETTANQVADQARQADQKAVQALTKAGASETLAQTAKQAADRAKTDAAAALTRAEAVKREAIAEAQRLDTVLRTDTESRLATAKTELLGKTEQLQAELDTAKRSVTSQARDILTQAQAQQDLTSRVQTVETTANGTKTTVAELTKTVNTATGNLASVTQRVASTETSLTNIRDRYSQISQTVSEQTGQITSINRQTADLQRGLDGTRASLKSIWVGDRNLLADTDKMSDQDPKRNASGSLATMFGRAVKRALVPANSAERAEGYRKALAVALYGDKEIIVSFYAKAHARGQVIRCQLLDSRNIIKLAETSTGNTNEASDGLVEFPVTNGWLRYWIRYTFAQPCYDAPTVVIGSLGGDVSASDRWVEVNSPAVYYGHHNREWSPSDVDIKTDWANYQQTVNQNLAELGGQIRTTNGSLSELRTSVNQTKDSIKLLASKTDVDAVTGRLTTAESSIRLQADQISQRVKSSDFDQAKQRLSTAESTIRQTATGQEQLATRLTETQSKVTLAETKITQLVGEVASKVSQTDFDTLRGTVSNHTTAITQANSAIALRAEKTYVDGVKATATDALAKATANASSISKATAELKVMSDGIAQLATKTDVDGVTGRLTTAEASIKTQADQISQRLTSSQVESAITAKGYQTKDQVDANVTGRGYITTAALADYVSTTSFDNYKTETAQSIERGLTETRALIPTEFSGNILKDGKQNWRNSRGATYTLDEDVEAERDYTLTIRYWNGSGSQAVSTNLFGSWQVGAYDSLVDAWVIRGRSSTRLNKGHQFLISAHPGTGLGNADWATLTKGPLAMSKYQEPMSNLVTAVDFNKVKETAQLYERIIGKTEGDITANLARQVMTSELYQTEVTKARDGQTNLLVGTEQTKELIFDRPNTRNYQVHALFSLFGNRTFAQHGFKIGDSLTLTFEYEVTDNNFRRIVFNNFRVEGYDTAYKFQMGVVASERTGTYRATFTFSTAEQLSAYQFSVRADAPELNCKLVIRDCRLNRGPASYPWQAHRADVEGVSTRVSQLADSWAVRVLGGEDAVLSAINAATGGVALSAGQNKLVVTPETTFIQNSTIKSAMIESVNAGKVTAGTLDAANVNIINLNANKLVGLDADFIKAKIETALVEWLQGKVISAQNDAMRINLNQANVSFNQDATIDFNSAQNALKRVRGGVTGFVQFSDDSQGGVYANFGVSSHNVGLRYDVDFGKFAGLRVQRASDSHDSVKVYGDTIDLRHGTTGRAYVFRPTRLQKNIDINSVINMVLSLAQCFKHIKGNGWDLSKSNVQAALADEIDTFMTTIDTYKQNRIHRG